MQCPNCSSEVPPGPACPRCGAPLVSSPKEGSVPLTTWQKARLIYGCVPLVFWALVFVFIAIFFDDIYGRPAPAAMVGFAGLIVLVVGWRAVQRIRDLLSGVALVRNDLLQRSWHARYGTGKYGNFAQLGR